MSFLALIAFVVLFFVDAGYGKFATVKWGPSVDNKIGWVIMESPVFMAMTMLWAFSTRTWQPTLLVIFLFFQFHYFRRSFVFPLLLKGKSRMPFSIVLMGVIFNLLNALMQGGWLFYISPVDRYSPEWLFSWQFISGTVIFLSGYFINVQSDSIIGNLRKPGDTRHYLPHGGLYNKVTSANYFGEIIEWCGFALLTWSWAGVVFAWWTFANLVPRAASINRHYKVEFKEEMEGKSLKRIFPFIY